MNHLCIVMFGTRLTWIWFGRHHSPMLTKQTEVQSQAAEMEQQFEKQGHYCVK